jgi:hypothetical protein
VLRLLSQHTFGLLQMHLLEQSKTVLGNQPQHQPQVSSNPSTQSPKYQTLDPKPCCGGGATLSVA